MLAAIYCAVSVIIAIYIVVENMFNKENINNYIFTCENKIRLICKFNLEKWLFSDFHL